MNYQQLARFSVPDDVLSQEVNGETVILDLETEVYFGLNDVGTRIWQLLQADNTLSEILDILANEYDVGLDQLERDMQELLGELSAAGLIKSVDSNGCIP